MRAANLSSSHCFKARPALGWMPTRGRLPVGTTPAAASTTAALSRSWGVTKLTGVILGSTPGKSVLTSSWFCQYQLLVSSPDPAMGQKVGASPSHCSRREAEPALTPSARAHAHRLESRSLDRRSHRIALFWHLEALPFFPTPTRAHRRSAPRRRSRAYGRRARSSFPRQAPNEAWALPGGALGMAGRVVRKSPRRSSRRQRCASRHVASSRRGPRGRRLEAADPKPRTRHEAEDRSPKAPPSREGPYTRGPPLSRRSAASLRDGAKNSFKTFSHQIPTEFPFGALSRGVSKVFGDTAVTTIAFELASASASGSFSGTRSPCLSWPTACGMPATSDATIAVPDAIASRSTLGRPSTLPASSRTEGTTTISAIAK